MTENTIEKLNSLGIKEITDYLSFSLTDGESIRPSLKLLENNGWKLTEMGRGKVTAVNIFSPSGALITELKTLGVENIIETLRFKIDEFQNIKPVDVDTVRHILEDEKFGSIQMDRQLINSVWGEIPFDIWHVTAKRKIYEGNIKSKPGDD